MSAAFHHVRNALILLVASVVSVGCGRDKVEGGGDSACVEAVWYQDDDGDGVGANAVVACSAPDGAVASGGDCDDADPAVLPGAPEVCNDRDDDCDELVDLDDLDLVDGLTVYVDLDADGWGDPDASRLACAVGPGTQLDAGDCDDQDDQVNPGASDDCDDGVDQDCDGADAVCPPYEGVTFDDADLRVFGWQELQNFGVYVRSVGDVFGTGTTAIGFGAHATDTNPEQGKSSEGALFLFTGAERGDVRADDAALVLRGRASGSRFGQALDGCGDITGDGQDDLLVSAVGQEIDGNERSGEVFLFAGPLAPDVGLDDATLTLTGTFDFQYLGQGLRGGADLTGDGWPDFAVSTQHYPAKGEFYGAIYVVDGTRSGSFPIGDPVITGVDRSTGFGDELADLRDLDGDGVADLVTGTAALDIGDTHNAGAAYVFLGPFSATRSADDRDTRLTGGPDGLSFGANLATGDVDADGYADLLVGGGWPSDFGGAWLFSGPLGAGELSDGSAVADFTCPTRACNSLTLGISAGGDVDGDGVGDVALHGGFLVGGRDWRSAVFLGYGPLEGSYDASVDLDVIVASDEPNAEVSMSNTVDITRDVDGDGRADILAGDATDTTKAPSGGVAWLMLGGW